MTAGGPFTLRCLPGGGGVQLWIQDLDAVRTETGMDEPAAVVIRFSWNAVETLQAGLARLSQVEMQRLRDELGRWVRGG